MHAVRASSERNVDAIIDEKGSTVTRADLTQLHRSRQKLSRGQRGGAQLHGRKSSGELRKRRIDSARVLRNEHQPQRSREVRRPIVHDRAGSPPITPPRGLDALP